MQSPLQPNITRIVAIAHVKIPIMERLGKISQAVGGEQGVLIRMAHCNVSRETVQIDGGLNGASWIVRVLRQQRGDDSC